MVWWTFINNTAKDSLEKHIYLFNIYVFIFTPNIVTQPFTNLFFQSVYIQLVCTVGEGYSTPVQAGYLHWNSYLVCKVKRHEISVTTLWTYLALKPLPFRAQPSHWQQYPESFSGLTWKSLMWSTKSCSESNSRWHWRIEAERREMTLWHWWSALLHNCSNLNLFLRSSAVIPHIVHVLYNFTSRFDGFFFWFKN